MALTFCDFETYFQYDQSPKTFQFKDITDYASQSVGLNEVTGVFEITDPAGNLIYNNTDFTDPDIDPDVILTSVKTILLPLDADGNVLQGDYIIKYTVRGSSGSIDPAVDVDKTYTHTLTYSSPTISLNLTANCVQPLLQSTDTTNYTSGTTDPTIVRDHKIIYPPALGKDDVTGIGVSLETNVFYTLKGTPLTHSSSLTSIITYDFGDNLFITDSISGTKFIDITCDGELCDVYCCLKAEWDRYTSNQGVNDKYASDHLSNWYQMVGLANLIRIALECGKDEHITGYVTKILELGNCEPGCGCSDGEPQLVTGLGGGVDTFVVESGGSPVVVTSTKSGTTTTYYVKLADDFVAKVSDLRNSIVTAGSGASVTPTTNPDGSITYEVSLTSTVTEPDMLSFIVNLAIADETAAPVITIEGKSNYGTAFKSNFTFEALYPSAPDWLKSNVIFKLSDFWLLQGSKKYKPSVSSIEATFRKVPELSFLGNNLLPVLTENNNDYLHIAMFAFTEGSTITGNYLSKNFSNIKMQITLIA